MRLLHRLHLVTLMIALIPVTASAQSQTRPGPDAATYNSQLQIGPVPGLTTAWHPAPTETAVPLGVTLQFKAKGRRAGTVEWTGAREIARRGTSTAECRLTTPGPRTITMAYTDGNGERRQESSKLNVIDTSVFPITLSTPRLWADPVLLDESSSNETTMRYFFGDSIAAVRRIGEGQYLTSTDRWFRLHVNVDPSGFAPLMEWRVNGKAQEHLGPTILMQIFPPRRHSIEIGSTDNPQKIKLDTYRVYITNYESRIDEIPEDSPVTFNAVTDPPGYEDEITWLASTKYGSCEPLIGHGPEFTVIFRNTFGDDGQWLGLKADQATIAHDHKENENNSDGEIGCSIVGGNCEIRSRDMRCRTTRLSIQHPDPHSSSVQFTSFGPFHSFDLTSRPEVPPEDKCISDCGETCSGFTCETFFGGCAALIAVECCGTDCSETCEVWEINECEEAVEPPPVGP